MFTGIVEEVGTVVGAAAAGGSTRVTIVAERCAPRLAPGGSIAVNGACLTVVECEGSMFAADVVEETLRKTALGVQLARKQVNLELPMRADGLLGGHIVLGHIDTTGTVSSIEDRGSSWWLTVRIPAEFLRYVVHTGSIALDGVSLTVAGLRDEFCRISVVPHTMRQTIFRHYRESDPVNVEVDILGKYVERMLADSRRRGGFRTPPTIDALKDQGY